MLSSSDEAEDDNEQPKSRSASKRTVEQKMAFGKPEDFHFEESEESFEILRILENSLAKSKVGLQYQLMST